MEKFKTEDIIKVLLPQWKKLMIITLIAAAVGYGITFFIKPLYKSYAVVYPVNLSPSSEESNTEQLLQWFNSEEVKHAVAKKFNLYKHYNIDSLEPKKETYFNLKYKELVSINATLYESIEISVKDQDPAMSQKIVYGIIEAVNDLITSIRRERLSEYIENNQVEFEVESHAADSIKILIDSMRKTYNIVDVNAQAKILLKKKHKGGSKSLDESENRTLDGLTNKVTELNTLGTVYSSQLGTYNYFRNEVNKFKFEYKSHISYTNVVSKPTLPDTKCYPIRSLMAIIIAASSFVVACIIIIFLNNKKQNIG